MIDEILSRNIFGNSVLAYGTAVGTAVVGVLGLALVKAVVLHRLEKWAEKTETLFDDFLLISVRRYLVPLLYFAIVNVALHGLKLNPAVEKGMGAASSVLVTIMGILFLSHSIRFLLFDVVIKRQTNAAELTNRFQAVMPALTIAIWIPGVVFLLENLGFRISAVVTGLGIGGVAVALAGSVILNDLFSYFAITLDQPFKIGDFIVVGEMMGTIEHIGIKTTRIRSLSGEILVFSNKDLTDARIRNFQQMRQRRVVFRLGVTYDTPVEKLAELPGVIRTLVKAIDKTSFDRSHFFQFGESSLDIETVYWVLSSDYNLYMDIHQSLSLSIMKEFQNRGIAFAYPTRTVHVESLPRGVPAAT